ncbi:MAG: hypothetical protein J4431_00290 [Candidatus Aenigmarchaeota archaeon]|nr:hypothetical protein [Candidatus Aenigmarchaeota archaeon]
MEMAIAFEHGKKIFILNAVDESAPYYEEIVATNPAILEGALEKLS